MPERFGGVLRERRRKRVVVAGLEKDEVLRRRDAAVLFECEIDAVFARRALEGLDVLVCDLDAGNALILSDELPDALLAADPDGTAELFLAAFLLLTGEVLLHRLLQHARRELRGVDREGNGAVFDFFLHGGSTPFCDLSMSIKQRRPAGRRAG